jgi:hypothetical protein
MARSSRNRRKGAESAGRIEIRAWYQDWILSFLLVMSAAPVSPGEVVQIVSRSDAVLTPDWAWTPLLTLWTRSLWSGEWPFWMFAVGISLIIVLLIQLALRESVHPARYAVLIALSLLAGPMDLTAGLILACACYWLASHERAACVIRSMVVFAILSLLAIGLCLDFSVVLFVLLALWVKPGCERPWRARVLLPLVAFLVCGPGAAFSQGFAAALARPVSWMAVPEPLIPMSPFPADSWPQWLAIGLAVVCLIVAWGTSWSATQTRVSLRVAVPVLCLLALSCRYYTWFSLAGVLCVTDWPEPRKPSDGSSRRWTYAAFVIALACLVPRWHTAWLFATQGSWPEESVAPSQWDSSGPVLLMQPGNADRWRSTALRDRHRVMIDDRWDLFSGEYSNYQRLCRDLREIRNSHYLLSDGTWGGYRHWIDLWKPSLLEVPASDTDSLRRLSLSPHWQVMGIDSRRVVFGLKDHEENSSQIRRMSTLFAELEWPSPQFDGDLRGAIVAVGDQQRMAVAKALLALRLPYAAMRLLPERHRDSDLLQALCYFELAHRAYRQARMPSLLDQYRAVSQLRVLLTHGRLTDRQTMRIALGLEELGELEVAIDFASRVAAESENRDAASLSSRAATLIDRCRDRLADSPPAKKSVLPDHKVRRILLAGRADAAKAVLPDLPAPFREVYTLLITAAESGPEPLYRNLIALLNRQDFPPEIRAEMTFYLGSLAVEIGDSPGAAQAFVEGIRIDPTLPLNSLSRVALRSLLKTVEP